MDTIFDLENDLDAFNEASLQEEAGQIYTEVCKKCGGKGTVSFGYTYVRTGTCFACNGKGKFEYLTSPEQRAKAKVQRETSKINKQVRNQEAFAAEHKAEWEWLVANGPSFEFAASLLQAVAKYGSLTERQLASVHKCIEKSAARAAEKAVVKAQQSARAADVDVSGVAKALQTALANGLGKPKLRLDVFQFSLAPAYGRNAGAVYVKSGEDYLGKIDNGRFFPVAACTEEQKAAIVAACANPAEAAIKYGHVSGKCSCCGRQLDNAESVARGIGPICAEKFGF